MTNKIEQAANEYADRFYKILFTPEARQVCTTDFIAGANYAMKEQGLSKPAQTALGSPSAIVNIRLSDYAKTPTTEAMKEEAIAFAEWMLKQRADTDLGGDMWEVTLNDGKTYFLGSAELYAKFQSEKGA